MATNPVQDILTPTLTQLLELVRAGLAARLNAVSWGQVESYDSELQEATVQIVPRRVWTDSTGTRQTERRAQLLNVPVWLPGNNGQGLTFGVNPGDFVMLLFLDQAADDWFRTGGADADPGDPRRHSLSDAVALAGFSPRPGRWDSPPNNAVLQDPSKVQLGSQSASKGVLTTQDGADFTTSLAYAIAQLVPGPATTQAILALTTLWQVLTGGTTPPIPTAPLPWPKGSSKVKADT